MKQNADLLGFAIGALFIVAFAITLCITIICKIDLSIWVTVSLYGSILSAIIGFSASEN